MFEIVTGEGGRSESLELRVLRLGLLQDWDVGFGLFPEIEEILVGGKRPDASGIGIRTLCGFRLQGIRPGYAQARQGPSPAVPDQAAVVENLLKLSRRRRTLSGGNIGFAANIGRIEAGVGGKWD